MLAIDPTVEFPFVVKDDQELNDDDPCKVTWWLQPLTAREASKVQDNLAAGSFQTQEMKVRSGTSELEILRMGIKRVENFRMTPESEQLEVETHKKGDRNLVVDRFLAKIPSKYRAEIADAISEAGAMPVETAEK